MLINVPEKITVKNYGTINKAVGYSYILSDISNRDKKEVLTLSGQGFYSYVYDVCDTYLFIVDNQKRNVDINPKKINFQEKVLSFEYTLQNKPQKIQSFNIPSKAFVVTAAEKWLQPDILKDKTEIVDRIIKNKKVYLQSYRQSYEQYMRYLCDNEGFGIFHYGIAKDTLTENKIYVLKDTELNGYIIKYNNAPFNC